MKPLTVDLLDLLLADHQPPCVSIFLPTHRSFPGVKEDRIRYKNLIARTEEVLRRGYAKSQVRELVEALQGVEWDGEVYVNRQREALAVFCAPGGLLEVVSLQQPVDELVVVSDTFHVKPLIRILEAADRYQVLCLTQRRVALYEGDQYALDQIPLRNVPQDILDVIGPQPELPHAWSMPHVGTERTTERAVHRTGVGGAPQVGGYHAHLERFFRVVDKALWENHSQLARLPLILCAVEHYHPIFHQVSRNPYLLAEAIRHDPESLTVERLREEAWRIMEPHHREQIAKVADMFRVAKSRQLGSDEPAQVAEAALRGKVGTVLLEANKHVGGRIDLRDGKVDLNAPASPTSNDLLDDIAETVLRRDGQVFVVPHDQMPSASGVAAIYRF